MNHERIAARPAGYVELASDAADALRAYVLAHEHRAAETHFGLSRTCIARAAARLPIHRGSVAVIVARLESSGAQP